jgi:hypothetical protein
MVYINVLKANDDKLFFKSELISKIIRFTLLIVSIPFGIKAIILGQIIQVIIVNFISGRFINKLLEDYSIKKQISDFLKPLIFALVIALSVFSIGYFLITEKLVELVLKLLVFGIMFIFHCRLQGVNLFNFFK